MCCLLASAAIALAGAGSAGAADLIVPAGSGVSAPFGLATAPEPLDPAGSLWASDGLRGLCRVTIPPAEPVGLAADALCSPLGSPGAGTQMVFDDVASNFYVGDRKSGAGGVWRLHWDPAAQELQAPSKIFDGALGNIRVEGLAFGPDRALYFTTSADNVVRRIQDPDALVPDAPQNVGFSIDPAAISMAFLDKTLYLAEPLAGLTRIVDPKVGSGVATVVAGIPAGRAASALAADNVRGRLYIGTLNPVDPDVVLALTGTGPSEQIVLYEEGFSGVTALHAAADGTLYITDDPLTASGAEEGAGASRIFSQPLVSLWRPRVTFTAGPAPIGNAAGATFEFETRPGATLECRLDDALWAPCTSPVIVEDVAEGAHVFEARGIDEADTSIVGPAKAYSFAVDRRRPIVTIDAPASGALLTADAADFRFSSDETGTRFTCSFNGEPFTACESPRGYGSLGKGTHVFRVRGTDPAGNDSLVAERDFSVGDPPPVPPAQAVAGITLSQIACRPIDQTGAASRALLAGRRAVVAITPPNGARYAKVTLRTRGRGARIVETLGYARLVDGGRRLSVSVSLGQRRKLRTGRYRVAVAYSTCRTRPGDWSFSDEGPRRPASGGAR